MTISSCLHRLPTGAAVLALAVLGLSATAAAAPTIAFKISAVPIPGVPGTGNILGAGAALQAHGTISGTEYGGSPLPVTGIKFYAPAGIKLHPSGFATCAPATIEKGTPGACPKKSIAGPKGFVTGVVSFGEARVSETVSVQPFFAPNGNLEFTVDGTTPAALDYLVSGHVTSASPPFGLEVAAEVPLIETVPGALDASAEKGTLRVGAAYRQGKKTISYITLPSRCPKGGLPVKVEVSFLGGAIAAGSGTMPCPRR
ncbi:MAG TPA: hypothetical protein VID29_09330 [Solirubrobacteraceae bacterium]|jgi:hypothetical protein